MNESRDKFLTEWLEKQLGLRIGAHKWDFSAWKGFGKLWEAAQKDEQWAIFTCDCPPLIAIELINPNRFATAWAKFKGWKENETLYVGHHFRSNENRNANKE